jgi:signal transduction histidine kinase
MKMTPLSRSRVLPLAIAGVLLLLLLTLAHLQWWWIGEVSKLERHRLEATLMMTGARMADDVHREVMRVFAALHPDFGAPTSERLEKMAGQLQRWRVTAPYPGLVRDVYMLRAGGEDGTGGPTLERLQVEEARFVAGPWPPQLAGLRARLREDWGEGGQPPAFVGPRLVASGVPVLLIPLVFPRLSGAGAGDPFAGSILLVELDQDILATEVLPQLARASLRWNAGEDIIMAVVDPSRPGHVVYRSDPAAPADARDADLSLSILSVRPVADLRPPWVASQAHHGRGHAAEVWEHMVGAASTDETQDGWRLLVRRRGRSVEQAVAALRWKNLAASLVILGLLALTTVVLVATTQRAQRLARQQIEFVAGVTHELHTPLTAIRAAGENLADGVVADPAQVRRYGLLIEGEGRRLSTMVAQLLELAGIQSGRRVYRFEPVEVGEIVDSALRESRWILEEAGFTVERDMPDGLPHLLADAGALRRGLQNLLENAVKYAGKERWLGVRARATADGIEIAVADRGPGIPSDERPHLFEPFFRGRDAAAGGVPGVGLGLALVRQIAVAHGGRVSVASESDGPERGTAFTLHLPAAPVPAPEVAA